MEDGGVEGGRLMQAGRLLWATAPEGRVSFDFRQ